MRAIERKLLLAVPAAIAAILYLGCGDSNDVAGPGPGNVALNVAGDWSGTYQSDDPLLCSSSAASATLEQQGAIVTGSFRALGCGIDGSFRGSVRGETLTGSINMVGGDIVEVSPPYDTTGATAIAGAHVAYELICLYHWARTQR